MSERDAFIRAIAADLYDDTPRLAFADYLDELGEHARAAFIRVQVELEPIRDEYELPRAAELHAREDQLRKEAEWLGDMPAGWGKWDVGGSVEFRRGFPNLLRCPAKAFIEFGAAVRERHPTMRRVVIHCLNGWGERLAACDALAGVPELELACWYADADMQALSASPHLSGLRVLELWMGRRVDGTTDADLVRLAARAKAWPTLCELVLLDPAGESEKDIKKLAASANRAAKRKLARYERGYPELFPLAPGFRYAFPGRLPDGRAALARLEGPRKDRHRDGFPTALVVLTFDPTGAQTDAVIRVPLSPELAKISWGDSSGHDADYERHLTDAIGFAPAFIRVKGYEFSGGDNGPYRGHEDTWSLRGLPDDPERPADANGDHEPNGCGGQIHWLIREGQFVVGHDTWADKRGHVHST